MKKLTGIAIVLALFIVLLTAGASQAFAQGPPPGYSWDRAVRYYSGQRRYDFPQSEPSPLPRRPVYSYWGSPGYGPPPGHVVPPGHPMPPGHPFPPGPPPHHHYGYNRPGYRPLPPPPPPAGRPVLGFQIVL